VKPLFRTVLFVAPHFPPSNLTAGHRTRLFVRHLPEFGYRPIVLSVRPECYEERLDPQLLQLVASDLDIVRTSALPTRPLRLVGDVGIRSFPYHLAAIGRLAAERKIDLIYIPIPPNYSALLGPLAYKLFGVPYAIDYIDPWVYPPTPQQRKSLKAMATHALARLLQPIALTAVAGITGVAEGYYARVLARHPRLRKLPSAGIPYGGEPLDHLAVNGMPARLLDRPELRGKKVLAYAGALLPRAHDTLRTLLRAFRRWVASGDPAAQEVRLLFVGTGARPNDPTSGLITPIAHEEGASAFVVEIADRQPYLDVLALLHAVQGVLILGSSEANYTASKTFQALHSGRPILALLHAGSTAAGFLHGVPGVELVTFTDEHPVTEHEAVIESSLRAVTAATPEAVPRDLSSLDQYSAREMTRRLAAFFDSVLAQHSRK
jgi:hypothetical protein